MAESDTSGNGSDAAIPDRFERVTPESAEEYKVSFRKTGTIGLSSKTAEELWVKRGMTHAELFWDKDERELGVRPAKNAGKEVVGLENEESGGVLRVTKWMRQADIVPSETIQIPARWEEDHGWLLIDLDHPGATIWSKDISPEEIEWGSSVHGDM